MKRWDRAAAARSPDIESGQIVRSPEYVVIGRLMGPLADAGRAAARTTFAGSHIVDELLDTLAAKHLDADAARGDDRRPPRGGLPTHPADGLAGRRVEDDEARRPRVLDRVVVAEGDDDLPANDLHGARGLRPGVEPQPTLRPRPRLEADDGALRRSDVQPGRDEEVGPTHDAQRRELVSQRQLASPERLAALEALHGEPGRLVEAAPVQQKLGPLVPRDVDQLDECQLRAAGLALLEEAPPHTEGQARRQQREDEPQTQRRPTARLRRRRLARRGRRRLPVELLGGDLDGPTVRNQRPRGLQVLGGDAQLAPAARALEEPGVGTVGEGLDLAGDVVLGEQRGQTLGREQVLDHGELHGAIGSPRHAFLPVQRGSTPLNPLWREHARRSAGEGVRGRRCTSSGRCRRGRRR